MTFQLVYYSQQDPKWKQDILGFGDPGDTIGYVGCALTSVAMLVSGHGFIETPKTLNKKLQNLNGFASAGIRWGAVSQIYPQINMKSFISCASTDAPLGQIDASIAEGQPVIVMVDSTPRTRPFHALGFALCKRGQRLPYARPLALSTRCHQKNLSHAAI